MKLKKEQKEILLSWIAEGIRSDEMNARATLFKPPFNVTRAQVQYYRRTRNVQINVLKESQENEALKIGLARKCIRVQKLQRLAQLLEKDLFTKELIWLEDRKGVGSGTVAEVYNFFKFNRAEIETYRGLLDDIAKEVGDRVMKVAPTDPTGKEEYGADARYELLSKLLPGIAFEDEEGEVSEVNK